MKMKMSMKFLRMAVFALVGAMMISCSSDLDAPLTFEAKDAGAKVSFTLASTTTGNIQYSTDGSTWENYTSGQEITLAAAGDKVMFRGDNTTYAAKNTDYSKFSCSADCYIYGNVMSLIQSTGFAKLTSLSADYAFYGLFKENAHILNHAENPLVLPATTLTESCYSGMFYNCTSLTEAPELPAETLAKCSKKPV